MNMGSLGLILLLGLGALFPILRSAVQTPVYAQAFSAQLTATPDGPPDPTGPQHADGMNNPAPSHPGGIIVQPREGGTSQTGRIQVLILLSDIPTASIYVTVRQLPGMSETAASRLAQSQAARIEAAQQALLLQLTGPEINAMIIGRVQNTLNGIMAEVETDKITLIQQLPGVIAVHRLGTGTFDQPVLPGAPVNPSPPARPEDGIFPGGPIPSMTE